jgi:hypothetical protein
MYDPECPFCGEEMEPKASTGGRAAITPEEIEKFPWAVTHYYECGHCHSRSPYCFTPEEAYAAAQRADRARGEWGKPIWGRDHLDRPIITGAECSICHKVSEFQTHFCPNCGADMRQEANDER